MASKCKIQDRRASNAGKLSLVPYRVCRARIFKLSRSPVIDIKESITPAYVAWRVGMKTLFLYSVPAPIDCLKIPAQNADAGTNCAGKCLCVRMKGPRVLGTIDMIMNMKENI